MDGFFFLKRIIIIVIGELKQYYSDNLGQVQPANCYENSWKNPIINLFFFCNRTWIVDRESGREELIDTETSI